MGFVIFSAMGLYFLISIGVVMWTIRYAKKNGKSVKRWGLGAVLVMYLIPFWDWIPTVATHKYYCAKDSGFWVYKTVEQWKAENPGVTDLVETKGTPSRRIGDMRNFTDTYYLNQRINKLIKKTGPLLVNQWRWEQVLVDSKTNVVLVRAVDFSTGNGNIGGEPPFRFWLQNAGCTGGSAINDSRFHAFKNQLLGRQE